MSMQVSSLIPGSGIIIPTQKEKVPHPPLPIERQAARSASQTDARAEAIAGAYQPEVQRPQPPELRQTVAELEKISHALNRRLKFEIDQDSREIIVKVIDNETDKVIRVLPPEELQRLHSKIRETMGFLLDRMI